MPLAAQVIHTDGTSGVTTLIAPEVILFSSSSGAINLPGFSQGDLTIRISLNDGAAGTFTQPKSLVVYTPPVLDAVSPDTGAATGGSVVWITGSGFTALQPGFGLGNTAAAAQHTLRCRFGDTVQTDTPTFVNDTHVQCTTTWGANDPNGLPVAVALNGETFDTSGGRVRFFFFGLHPPALVHA